MAKTAQKMPKTYKTIKQNAKTVQKMSKTNKNLIIK